MLIVIIAVHLLLLMWLVTRPPAVQPVSDHGRGLLLISLADGERSAAPSTKPKPPPPSLIPPPAIILPSLLATPTAAQTPSPSDAGAPQAGEAGGCALPVRTAEAIARDPAAMAELAALAPLYRTSADAVLLWNGQWLATGQEAGAVPVMPALRRIVEQVVTEASPECRATPTNGPQFLAIPEQDRTTTLVIGSGTWRWSDLLATSATCLSGAPEACLPPSPITDR